jgi:lysophospholipase L1-like esterase
MNQGNLVESHSQSPEPAPPLQVGRALRILGRDLLVLVVIFGIAEVVLQVAAGTGGCPELHDADFTGGKPNAVNGQGLRGPDVAPAKKLGEFRLMGLGDSTTFGTGVAWEDAWPNQCAARLAAGLRREVTGINAGVPAASVKDMAFAMDHAWGDLQPDVVVLVTTGNLVSLAWIRRDQNGAMPAHEKPPADSLAYSVKTAINRRFRYLRFPGLLTMMSERATYMLGLQNHNIDASAPYGALLAHGWRQPGLDPALSEAAWQVFEQDLALLRDRVRARRSHLYVAALPARFMLGDGPGDNEKSIPLHRLSIVPGEWVRDICQRLDVAFIDLTRALKLARAREDKPFYQAMDYAHLDSDGHRVIANAIAERIAQDFRTPW